MPKPKQTWQDLVVAEGGATVNGRKYEAGEKIGAVQVNAAEAWLINTGLVRCVERSDEEGAD